MSRLTLRLGVVATAVVMAAAAWFAINGLRRSATPSAAVSTEQRTSPDVATLSAAAPAGLPDASQSRATSDDTGPADATGSAGASGRAGETGSTRPSLLRRSADAAAGAIDATAGLVAGVAASITDRLDGSPHYHLQLGEQALQLGLFDQAEPHFARALALQPDSAAARIGLALSAVGRDNYARADALLAEVLRAEPWQVDALYKRGVLRMRQQKYHDAEADYRKVLTTQPDHFHARYNLAVIATHYGRLGEARDLWAEVVRQRPDLTDARINLGLVYLQLKEPDKAIAQFDVVLKARPKDPDLWNNMGLAYQAKRQYDHALRHFQKAYELAPRDASAVVIINNLADLHLVLHQRGEDETQHLSQAKLLWRQSLLITPEQPRLKDLLEFYKLARNDRPAPPPGGALPERP